MIAWMKAIHIATLSIWCAGLISVPLMLLRRPDIVGDQLYALQRATRFAFIIVISPAAFIAIGTGTALIFAQETFTLWFALKLLFVGILAKIHIRTGSEVVEVFKEEGSFPAWKAVGAITAASLATSAILVTVLWKPPLDDFPIPSAMFQPGWLGEALGFGSDLPHVGPQSSLDMRMPTP